MAVDVLVPPLGQTVDTMTIVHWYKNEGDTVTIGEPLFAIETDKANLDIESPATGILQSVAAQAGDEVRVLSKLAVIVQPDDVTAGSGTRSGAPASAAAPAAVASSGGEAARPDAPASRQRVFISPRARQLAAQHSVDFAQMKGTGPTGAIIERDIRAALRIQGSPRAITPVALRMATDAGLDWRSLPGGGAHGQVTREDVARALAPAAPAEPAMEAKPEAAGVAAQRVDSVEVAETIPVRGRRAVIAQRMVESHARTAPVTLASEADATALVGLRQQLQQDGASVSYTDLFVRVAARALADHPRLNCSLDGDAIRIWKDVHIGIAVDTERGLLVPVVRDADRKGLHDIAKATAALAVRAQAGQCTPDEMSGGRFTVTNLGMFGIDMFTPIINLPECAILGVGRIKTEPTMVGGAVLGREKVWLSLTFDHRLVDGAPAARFLQRVVQLVERPHLLLT